ncbi:transcription factor IIF subunit tfg1 [Coemansia sp. RSA 552]|nr:transcription factor IIF subunit tfg1 [Coemansia sp. RSA 552]
MSSGVRPAAKRRGGSSGVSGMRGRPTPRQPQQQQPPQSQGGSETLDTRGSTDYTLMSSAQRRTNNVMRFLSTKDVDMTQFTPPVKMRRRNREYYRLKNKKRAEAAAAAAAAKDEPDEIKEDGGLDQVQEVVPQRPKADMNLIADVGSARRNKRNLFKKRTKQVFFANEDKRRLDIEEARPWVLEDDDEQEVWTGSLEGGQNSEFVLFVLAEDGFRVVPVNRWYKFAPKLKYRTMSLDEAEEELRRLQKANADQDRWIMHRRGAEDEEEGGAPKASSSTAVGESEPRPSLVEYEADLISSDDAASGDERKQRPTKKSLFGKHGAADEVEFEMEFEDDEELGDVRFEFNEEQETERSAQKGRDHDMLFGSDDEDGDDSQQKPGSDKDSRSLRKLISKREENPDYESDREVNPYLSEEFESSSSDDDEPDKKPEDKKPDDADKKPQELPAKPPATPQQPPPSSSSASGSVKKRKRTSTPHRTAAAATPADARKHFKGQQQASPPASNLITKQEIVDLIRNGVSTTKELIGHVRKKLKANPENRQRIHSIIKEVATYKNNKLGLKRP